MSWDSPNRCHKNRSSANRGKNVFKDTSTLEGVATCNVFFFSNQRHENLVLDKKTVIRPYKPYISPMWGAWFWNELVASKNKSTIIVSIQFAVFLFLVQQKDQEVPEISANLHPQLGSSRSKELRSSSHPTLPLLEASRRVGSVNNHSLGGAIYIYIGVCDM